MRIREAAGDEGVQIQALLTECGTAMSAAGFDNWNPPPPPEATLAAIANHEVFVALDVNDEIVGTVTLLRDGVIKRLAVRPTAQKSGLGATLMKWIEEKALHSGFREVKLDALASNAALIRFYEKLGYQRELEHERGGWRFMRMKKTLTAA